MHNVHSERLLIYKKQFNMHFEMLTEALILTETFI